MKCLFYKIALLLFVLSASCLHAQTPGFNYQALILNNKDIQVPGSNIKENSVPLGLEKVVLRFTIENADKIEYIEEQQVITDENGMISVIVGEGTPINSSFSDIVWDGKIKYLNVEINIPSNNKGFVLLDIQKILYIPHPTEGSRVKIVKTITDLIPPYTKGDLIWAQGFRENNYPSLLVWDGSNWVPVSNDFDPTNELGLIVAVNAKDRDTQLPNPKAGDQVWNKTCDCIQVYNATSWIDMGQALTVTNGLTKSGNTVEFGGALIKPTSLTTSTTNTLAIKGLETDDLNTNEIMVVDKATGVLKTTPSSSITKQEQKVIIATVVGQKSFSTPFAITDPNKINVFRNGVKVDFIAINSNVIEVEFEAKCYPGDEIRIVQIN